VASAHAVGQGDVVRAVDASAVSAGFSAEGMTSAKAAAAMMGMNNIYYRSLHIMHNQEYRTLPARLRMNILANPGVEKLDFELWCTAVSAINGCGACLDSHEQTLKKDGVPTVNIHTALRIAAVVNAVSRVMAGEAAAKG